MKVRTLFFASYRELMGSAEIDVELPEGATVTDLIAALRGRTEASSSLPLEPAVALNRSYCAGDAELSDGDEVALIPPVAGG